MYTACTWSVTEQVREEARDHTTKLQETSTSDMMWNLDGKYLLSLICTTNKYLKESECW